MLFSIPPFLICLSSLDLVDDDHNNVIEIEESFDEDELRMEGIFQMESEAVAIQKDVMLSIGMVTWINCEEMSWLLQFYLFFFR